ncbi:hypothetical protein RYX36_036642 [Vicia faba]
MEEHNSIFVYQEPEREQKQKLYDTTLELELVKNMNTELYNMLMKVRRERDEARNLLQKLLNNRFPIEFQQENSLGFLHSSISSSNITQYGSFSHCSPSSSSSPEIPNTSMSHVNHYHNQSFNYSMMPIKRSVCDDDYGSRYIDNIAKKRVLPQKGKLLQAVYDAGPLLQTILDDGHLPTWRNTHSQDFNSNFRSQVDSMKRQKHK